MKRTIRIIFMLMLVMLTASYLQSCKKKQVTKQTSTVKKQTYTCPMHPQIISEKTGNCPICGMELVPFDKSSASDFLTLSIPQQALANVTTDTVRTGSFASYKRLNARLVVDPQQTTFISSRVAGRIEALYIRETGVSVRKGQPLYKIYSEQLAALQQEYLVTLAQANQFPGDVKFQQLLSGAKQKLLLYSQTEAQVQQLASRKQTSPYVTYSSPEDGIISQLFITEGQYVGEGTSIASVEGYNNIWVEADVYPAEAELVKKGKTVTVRVAGFEEEPQKSKVDFIAPALQQSSQLLTIRGTIPNLHHRLKAGMQASVELPTISTTNAVTLPVDAVIRDGKGAHIWVQSGIGKFKPQVVETGAENFDRVEIKSGVKEGDVVVVSGAYLLYSEFILKKGKNPMDMHH